MNTDNVDELNNNEMETLQGLNKTPPRSNENLRKRALIAPSARKIGLPIVQSKIGVSDNEAQNLVAHSNKVANGVKTNLEGNFNHNDEELAKIPKTLEHIISKQKVQPDESPLNKRIKIADDSRSISPTGFNPGVNISIKTVNTSHGVKMKRVDAKAPPTSNKEVRNNKTVVTKKKPNLDPKFTNGKQSSTSTNINDKQKSVPQPRQIMSNNNFPPSKSKAKKISIVTESKSFHHKPSSQSTSQLNSELNDTSKSAAGESNLPAVEDFKTLKEFLNMPPVGPVHVVSFSDPPVPAIVTPTPSPKVSARSEKKAEDSKPTYFKSKFWEYVDPNKKEVRPATTEKTRNYDLKSVKSFMDKQREMQREKSAAEDKARQEEIRKKETRLQELNKKRLELLSKTNQKISTSRSKPGKTKSATSSSITGSAHTYKVMRKEVEDLVNKIVPPDKVRSSPGLATTGKTKSALSKLVAQLPISIGKSPHKSEPHILLQEFEAIVKRECINFFQAKKGENTARAQTSTSKLFSQADKAVGTTESLDELNKSRSSISSACSTSTVISSARDLQDYHQAASKIQAGYRGFKQRKILKEANLLPSDLIKIKNLLKLGSFDKAFFVSKTPEKPYDNEISNFKDGKQQLTNNSYVPPTTTPGTSSKVDTHAQTLPCGKISKKSFNEPYPKEAIQRIQEAQAAEASLSRRNSISNYCTSLLNDSIIKKSLDSGGIRSPATQTPNKRSSTRRSEPMGLRVPSISAVLFEKLRLLENEKNAPPKSISATSVAANSDTEGAEGLERDFESVSSITRGSQKLDELPSQDVTITDDYFGPSDSEVRHKTRTSTPLQEKKNSNSNRASSSDSATTVETDFELVPSSSKTKVSGEEPNLTSSVPNETTNYSVPIPALKLQYHAEQERLKVLEKALQASIYYEKTSKPKNAHTKSEIVEIAKTVADEQIKQSMVKLEQDKLEVLIKQQQEQAKCDPSNNLQLEMLKCHKEAANATAEISKWVVDLGKSFIEDRQRQNVQDPINLATIVYAAVDEAQRIALAERRKRQEQRQSLQRDSAQAKEPQPQDVSQQYPSISSEQYSQNIDTLDSEDAREKYSLNFEKEKEDTEQELSNLLESVNNDDLKELEDNNFLGKEVETKEKRDSSTAHDTIQEYLPIAAQNIDDNSLDSVEPREKSSEFEKEKEDTEQEISYMLEKEDTEQEVVSYLVKSKDEQIEVVEESCGEKKEEENTDQNVSYLAENENTEQEVSFLEEKEITEQLGDVEDSHENKLKENTEKEVSVLVEKEVTNQIEIVEKSEEKKQKEGTGQEVSILAENQLKDVEVSSRASEQPAIEVDCKYDTEILKVIEEKVEEIEPKEIQIQELDKEILGSSTEAQNIDNKTPDPEEAIEKYSTNSEKEEETDQEVSYLIESVNEELEVSDANEPAVELNRENDTEHLKLAEEKDHVEKEPKEVEELNTEKSNSPHDTIQEYLAAQNSPDEASEKYLSDFEKEEEDTEQEVSYMVSSDNEQLEDVEKSETNEEEADREDDEELIKVIEEKNRVEKEIQELIKEKRESLESQSPTAHDNIKEYLTAVEEQEGRVRSPPPPYYSPGPALEVLLFSIRASNIQLITKGLVMESINTHVDEMWDTWANTGKVIESYSDQTLPEIEKEGEDDEEIDEDDETGNYVANQQYADQNSEFFINFNVIECIENALYCFLETDVGYVDTMRKGQFAVEALLNKRPKTKSDLVATVYRLMTDRLPHLQDPKSKQSSNKTDKWSCKPRDNVENLLLSNMLECESQWLDVWPEALLAAEEVSENVSDICLQEVLEAFEIAFNDD